MNVSQLLMLMIQKNASDMFLTSGAIPHIKVEGKMYPLGEAPFRPEMVQRIALELMGEDRQRAFERDWEMNFALKLDQPGGGRFRVNVFRQQGETALVIRAIKSHIPSIDDLQLPEVLKDIIMTQRGLVLVVGATGSGKSTTLASMIDHRNQSTAGHILTIEDPVEFVHTHKKCIVNQREVGIDTHGFHNALKNAMREAPDVILIGEILDKETMEAAISFAETGHLCLATLHSNNADQTIERILNFFPEPSHKNILMNLSLNLKAVVSQRLVIGVGGKRIPACEILLNTSLIADLLRRGQIHEVKEAMEGSLEPGIQTFDTCLYNMVKNKQVSEEEAVRHADSKDGLKLKLRFGHQSALPDPANASDASGLVLSDDPYNI